MYQHICFRDFSTLRYRHAEIRLAPTSAGNVDNHWNDGPLPESQLFWRAAHLPGIRIIGYALVALGYPGSVYRRNLAPEYAA
jgi:hypothetical protein